MILVLLLHQLIQEFEGDLELMLIFHCLFDQSHQSILIVFDSLKNKHIFH